MFLPVGVAKAVDYVRLTKEGCDQYAELLVKKANGVQVDESQYSEDARTVTDWVLENNKDLDQIPAPLLYNEALGGCYAAQGQTIVPQRTRI